LGQVTRDINDNLRIECGYLFAEIRGVFLGRAVYSDSTDLAPCRVRLIGFLKAAADADNVESRFDQFRRQIRSDMASAPNNCD
jgi:hypothetical protein